jgi:hypothetical protein
MSTKNYLKQNYHQRPSIWRLVLEWFLDVVDVIVLFIVIIIELAKRAFFKLKNNKN